MFPAIAQITTVLQDTKDDTAAAASISGTANMVDTATIA